MPLPRPCRRCGRPGCQQHQEQRTNPYHSMEYRRNRAIMVNRAWALRLPCWKCGRYFGAKSDITADHIVMLKDGGTHALSNLAPACEPCNKGWRGEPVQRRAVMPEPVNPNDYMEWLAPIEKACFLFLRPHRISMLFVFRPRMRVKCFGCTSAFQADRAGSIPVTRSHRISMLFVLPAL